MMRKAQGRINPANCSNDSVTADSEGAFRISGLMPDTPIALQAELDGLLSDIVTITAIEPGMERLGIVLRML